MYVGHAFLAFALAAVLARRLGLERRRSYAVGLVAAACGMAPDVDMWHTAYVVARAGPTNVFPTTQHVWPSSWVVHRTLTHSLVVGVAAAVVVVCFCDSLESQRVSPSPTWRFRAAIVGCLALSAALFRLALLTDERLGLVTIGLFLGVVFAVAWWGARHGLGPLEVGGGAAVGLLSHPFGDLWMGAPPAFLYPVSSRPPVDQVSFAAEPTYNLLIALGVELTLALAAVVVAVHLVGRSALEFVHPAAVLGVLAPVLLVVVPPPTFRVAYQFVFGVLLVGGVAGAIATLTADGRPRFDRTALAATSALGATTLGVVTYAAAYALA